MEVVLVAAAAVPVARPKAVAAPRRVATQIKLPYTVAADILVADGREDELWVPSCLKVKRIAVLRHAFL